MIQLRSCIEVKIIRYKNIFLIHFYTCFLKIQGHDTSPKINTNEIATNRAPLRILTSNIQIKLVNSL